MELIWFLNQCDSSANTIIEKIFFTLNTKQGSQPNFFNIPGTGKAIFCCFLLTLEALQFSKSIPKRSGEVSE